MHLDRVTITGADDSVNILEMEAISKRFDFVEWGILFSFKRQGQPRFPSIQWIANMVVELAETDMKFSAHLCGSWVGDLVKSAKFEFKDAFPRVWPIFQRVQLNFHGQYHKAHDNFMPLLQQYGTKDWIFQHDGQNDGLIQHFIDQKKARVYPLFDMSVVRGLRRFTGRPRWELIVATPGAWARTTSSSSSIESTT